MKDIIYTIIGILIMCCIIAMFTGIYIAIWSSFMFGCKVAISSLVSAFILNLVQDSMD